MKIPVQPVFSAEFLKRQQDFGKLMRELMEEQDMNADDLDAIINGPEEVPTSKLPPALRASMEKEVKGRKEVKGS